MEAEELEELRNGRAGPEERKDGEVRTPAEIDRDRILYSTSLRRLAEVTQVVRASEGYLVHNRLTHVLKVAQLGRRLAERLLKQNPREAVLFFGGLDPDVVESAGLAHDLGHPPFGHRAEQALQEVCEDSKEAFEGNAQSFRIVTKHSARTRRSKVEGLNLTRATLNAILKYPFPQTGAIKGKWGVYVAETAEYEHAREAAPYRESKTLEAELMDWADDVAYAVYDMDDFYRAGMIPLDLLIEGAPQGAQGSGRKALDRFLDSVQQRWKREGDEKKLEKWTEYKSQFKNLLHAVQQLAPQGRYIGSRTQRGALRSMTSFLVNRYMQACRLAEPQGDSYGFGKEKRAPYSPVRLEESLKMEVVMLKQLTWTYVIESSELAAQQEGQKAIITRLYQFYADAAKDNDWRVFPTSVRDDILDIQETLQNDANARFRTVIDLIAHLTEVQAYEIYQRLTGHSSTSVFNRVTS